MTIRRRGMVAGLAITAALAAVPLTTSVVTATADPAPATTTADPQAYNFAECDRPELKDDKAFQDWCANVRWANDPVNPMNPHSLLNEHSAISPNNPKNPNSALNPNHHH